MSSQTLTQLAQIISVAVNVYIWIIIIRIILSWFQPNPNTPFMRFLSKLTDGPLYFARRTFPLRLGGLDFSPLILIILLSLAGYLVSLTMLLKAQDIPLVHIFPIMAVKIIATLQSIIILIGILIVIRLILSLANPSYGNPLALFIYAATEPLLSPLRRWFPYGPGGLDVKALVFLAGLAVLYLLLGQLLPG